MKYLVIGALFALLLLLIYSRVYPYLLALKKILTAARNITDSNFSVNAENRSAQPVDRKLVRCVGCGLWIPADRATGARNGSSTYCSRECMEKGAGPNRKIAS